MPTILVIDDDATARDLLATLLGYAGHEVHAEEDAARALTWLQHVTPDLIIVDLLMPGVDGLEFVRRLRQNAALASIRVVFYTASYLQSEAKSLADACGVGHIISKPAEPEEIFRVVNDALGKPGTLPPAPAAVDAQQEYLTRLTAALSQKAAQVVPRLEAMIALGLRLASERDPERLLADFCDASRRIIGARLAIVAVREREGRALRYHFASGLPGNADRVHAVQWDRGIYQEVFESRKARRLRDLAGDPDLVGLAAAHGPVRALLCVPIQSPLRVYGWLLLVDRSGATEFSSEDEALAQILSAQVGRIYENGSLYNDVKRYAERLEEEIAERKQAQNEIRTLNAALEQRIHERTSQLLEANAELEAFGYTISHDLRGPLRALGAYSSLVLETEAERLTESGRRYLQLSLDNVHRMSRMVDDLLAFSRLGRHALTLEDVNMTELVEEVWKEQLQLDGRPAQLHLTELPRAMADRSLLREVWGNLVANALKYSGKNPQRSIHIGGNRDDEDLHYSIADNGVGFDMAHVAKLFRVFERLHSAQDFAGTGAGLAIVDRIVRRHGGRVWAESEVGKGATFHFALPATTR